MKRKNGEGGKKPHFRREPSPPVKARAAAAPGRGRGQGPVAEGSGPAGRSFTHGRSSCRAPSHPPRRISISSSCTGIAARINFHIEYLGIQPMYILYKYFHLGGTEQAFWNKGHRSSSLTPWAPSALDRQRFCGNSRLCVVPSAHCPLHEAFPALAVACGHPGVSRCPKGGLEGATSRTALSVPWFSPVGAAPAEPTQRTEHLGHGKAAGKGLNPATLPASHHCHRFVGWGECQGQSGVCGHADEASAGASGAPAARLAPRARLGTGPVPAGQPRGQRLHTPRARSPRTLARGAGTPKQRCACTEPCPDRALSLWPQGEEQKAPNFTRQNGPLTPEPTLQLHSNNHWDLPVTVSLYTIKQLQPWEKMLWKQKDLKKYFQPLHLEEAQRKNGSKYIIKPQRLHPRDLSFHVHLTVKPVPAQHSSALRNTLQPVLLPAPAPHTIPVWCTWWESLHCPCFKGFFFPHFLSFHVMSKIICDHCF